MLGQLTSMPGVLGIDPGIENTGWGLLRLEPDPTNFVGSDIQYTVRHVGHGVISTRPDTPLPKRLRAIFVAVRALLHEHELLFVAIEEYMGGLNRTSGALVLQAKGAVLTACGSANTNVRTYTASAIKKEITGRGNAKKEDVRIAISHLLHIEGIRFSHESDALATAATGIRKISDDDRDRLLRKPPGKQGRR